jgi:hypothetical protein
MIRTFVPLMYVSEDTVFSLLLIVMIITNVPMILAVYQLANVITSLSSVMITTNVLKITATHPVDVLSLTSLAIKRIVWL